MKSYSIVLLILTCFFFSQGAFTSQIEPPSDHLTVMVKVVKIVIKPNEVEKSTDISWKLKDGPQQNYKIVLASVVKVLEVDSWNKDEALKFKMNVFIKVPKKYAKLNQQFKVWIADKQHPGSMNLREIETFFDRPFWAGLQK